MVECPSLVGDLVPCSNLHVVVSFSEGVSPAAAGQLPPPLQICSNAFVQLTHVLHSMLETPGHPEEIASPMCQSVALPATLTEA